MAVSQHSKSNFTSERMIKIDSKVETLKEEEADDTNTASQDLGVAVQKDSDVSNDSDSSEEEVVESPQEKKRRTKRDTNKQKATKRKQKSQKISPKQQDEHIEKGKWFYMKLNYLFINSKIGQSLFNKNHV